MSQTKHTKTDGHTVEKLGRKQYERELAHLQRELVRPQEWVVREGAKVCIVFEGRDTAGKGGVIKRITERVSPRVFRVVALPARRAASTARQASFNTPCSLNAFTTPWATARTSSSVRRHQAHRRRTASACSC